MTSRQEDAGSASWSGVATFPRTSALLRGSRPHSEALPADDDGAPLLPPHGNTAEVRRAVASPHRRDVNLTSALSSATTSSRAGTLSAVVMPASSSSVPEPPPAQDVSVAASASAARSENASQALTASALSAPPTTPTTINGSRPLCSVVGGCGISPKLAELLHAVATQEDEDAPCLNIPGELLYRGSSCDARSALRGGRGELDTTTPLKSVMRACPTGPPSTAGCGRRSSPLSRAVISAAETLMVDPDAPWPGRQHWRYKITQASREGRCGASTAAALRPLTPLSGTTGSTTPFISLVTNDDVPTTASPLAVARTTTVSPSITSPPSSSGAMLCFSTPKSPLSGADPAINSAALRGSTFAVTRSLRSSDAPSSFLVSTGTGCSHAAPDAPPPPSPFTPSDSHGGGGGGGQHMEASRCFQGFAAYSHHLLEQQIPLSTHGRSAQAASLLELVRRAASVASAQSMSDSTDAPYLLEGLLDDTTATSLGEDDDLLRDTSCGEDFSCDVFEDGKMCEAVAKGALPPLAADGSVSELSPCQQLTCLPGHRDVRTGATAGSFNADGLAARSPTAAHAPPVRTTRRLHMSLVYTTATSDTASSHGSGGGGSTGLSTFDRSTRAAPQQVFAVHGALPCPPSAQARNSASGSSCLLARSSSVTTESSISAPNLPVFVPTSYSACLLGAAPFDSGAGGRPFHSCASRCATPFHETELCTAADITARAAQRPHSRHRHAGNKNRNGCSGGVSLQRPLSDPQGALGGAQNSIKQPHSSSRAERHLQSAESSRNVSGWGRGSDGKENDRCGPFSAPWMRRIALPPRRHLCSLSSVPCSLASTSLAVTEEGHAGDAHVGDGCAIGSQALATCATPLPFSPCQGPPALLPVTPHTGVVRVADGPESGSSSAHGRQTTVVTLASPLNEATKNAQNRAALSRAGAHGRAALSPLSGCDRERKRSCHRHELQQNWLLRLLRLRAPYVVLVGLLTLTVFVATQVVSEGVVLNSLAARDTYGLPDLDTCMEDVMLLYFVQHESVTCTHSKDLARPCRGVAKDADLTKSMSVHSCVGMIASVLRDEARYIPSQRGAREGGSRVLNSTWVCIGVESSRIVLRGWRETAQEARTQPRTTCDPLQSFAEKCALLRHSILSTPTASKCNESAHENPPWYQDEVTAGTVTLSGTGGAKTCAAAPLGNVVAHSGYAVDGRCCTVE
ncbi:hypothetical protein, conserved [Leishmania tarentolae]|uniref:Uncharacterized protein n=1 Tax=Leishmania tarentolae TaxID=5689 RepID=A0A640K9C9_LEITA|nr:hypothetical protein, conserved [Leishmania tarentolae]